MNAKSPHTGVLSLPLDLLAVRLLVSPSIRSDGCWGHGDTTLNNVGRIHFFQTPISSIWRTLLTRSRSPLKVRWDCQIPTVVPFQRKIYAPRRGKKEGEAEACLYSGPPRICPRVHQHKRWKRLHFRLGPRARNELPEILYQTPLLSQRPKE